MNKFDVLLSFLAKFKEEHIGTVIADMGSYTDKSYIDLKLQDGSEVKLEVTYKEPPKEPIDVQD